MKEKIENENGFTLIEVLIAITVLSMLMAMIYSIISGGADTNHKVINEDRDFIQVETALNRIQDDFSQAFSPIYYSIIPPTKEKQRSNNRKRWSYSRSDFFTDVNEKGHLFPAFISEEKSEFSFFTSANRRKIENAKQSRYAWVKYELIKNEDLDSENPRDQNGPNILVRKVKSVDIYNRQEQAFDDIRPQPLLKHVKGILFEYWDPKKKKFIDRIRELDNRNLITSIRVTLDWITTDGNEMQFVRVFRPMWTAFDHKKELQDIEIMKKRKPVKVEDDEG